MECADELLLLFFAEIKNPGSGSRRKHLLLQCRARGILPVEQAIYAAPVLLLGKNETVASGEIIVKTGTAVESQNGGRFILPHGIGETEKELACPLVIL